MSSRARTLIVVAGVVMAVAVLGSTPAHAWPCRWRASFCGPVVNPCLPLCAPAPWSYQPLCGPTFCRPGWGYGGWGFDGCGFGVTSYRVVSYSTPGFWCGSWYPCVVPLYAGGLYSFYPVPIYPGPVFRPWVPFAQRPAARVTQVAVRPVGAVRVVNQATRLRAAKLVAIGDRHLRSAVADRAKLRSALDAYRRAETIAADEPDTLLRQALVLTALDRPDDAEAALRKAAAIDGRLADAPAPAAVAARLPPDPVFGDRPLGSPSPLAARSAGLVAGIFGAEGGVGDGANWIADRWARRWPDGRGLIAAK